MTAAQQALLDSLPPTSQAMLLRIARRVAEGFEGEVEVQVRKGGIARLRWTQTEFADVIRSELTAGRNGR